MRREVGRYERTAVAGETVSAFIPDPLPPTNPRLSLDAATSDLLRSAEQKLSRLDLAGEMVPSIEWFIYAFVRKEAVVSSQIEGTQATLVDLLAFEANVEASASTAPTGDVQDVSNYVDALVYARRQLESPKGLPLSMRLLNEAHRRLMKGGRGASTQPGEIRRSQNWIGGTRPGNAAFVPPPPNELGRLLSDLEKYIHRDDELPPLVRAALVHVQFESIHPYLDGNGRIGRLLITLLLEQWKLLSQPLLYLSLFFKQHRAEYYRLLNAVRLEGAWEAWAAFFLEGVSTIADEAATTARDLFVLVNKDRARVLGARNSSVTAARLLELLPRHPMVTIPAIVRLLDTSKPTAAKAVSVLERLDILKETTGRRRDRTYGYSAYMERLRAGTDLER
ncbi:MAG: Fic family protein [Deltaproteobacteria bacterium]|nr:MAG: Fic family protein [Deltaproteobacteria bacterium]